MRAVAHRGDIPWRRYFASFANVKVKGSRVHGRGLFARRPIAAGDRVVEYLGRRMTKHQSEELTEAQWERGLVYTFTLNSRYDLDGDVWWSRARFANHACSPNCEAQVVRGRVWIVALRDIARGEEITYDYNFPATGELHKCRCGTEGCSGYLVGKASRGALTRRLKRESAGA